MEFPLFSHSFFSYLFFRIFFLLKTHTWNLILFSCTCFDNNEVSQFCQQKLTPIGTQKSVFFFKKISFLYYYLVISILLSTFLFSMIFGFKPFCWFRMRFGAGEPNHFLTEFALIHFILCKQQSNHFQFSFVSLSHF